MIVSRSLEWASQQSKAWKGYIFRSVLGLSYPTEEYFRREVSYAEVAPQMMEAYEAYECNAREEA